MTDERLLRHFPALARLLGKMAVPPASTLEELCARLRAREAEPNPLQRKLGVLAEIEYALQGASPTFTQIVEIALDDARKTIVGPNAKPALEVMQLAEAAADVTFLMDDEGASGTDAYAVVAKYAGVDKKKLKALRQNIQRGRQAPDVCRAYWVRLGALYLSSPTLVDAVEWHFRPVDMP